MIDAATFDSLGDEDTCRAAKALMSALAGCGVIQLQIQLEKEKILSGDVEQSQDELAAQIRNFRLVTQQLLTLQQLGEQFRRELER